MVTVSLVSAPLDFTLPSGREAREPAEVRGTGRDDVRMLVAHRGEGRLTHAHFRDLPGFLRPGDLLVINTSATLPASLPAARLDGSLLHLHLSTKMPGGGWTVELRRPAGRGTEPFLEAAAGERLLLPDGATATVLSPYPVRATTASRLWVALLEVPGPLPAYLARHGRPIRYGYVEGEWPLEAYQTVYAVEPGSAEMPSAGRPFTPELVTALVARGVGVAPLVLHAGVSSGEAGEPPYPEWFRVPADTARRVNATRRWGGRVVAVGTTVVRALESVADEAGLAHPGEGWTEKVVTAQGGVVVVDGLLTGWHEPLASHLGMLEAVAGRPLLEASYRAALDGGYLWHELGDVHLVSPSAARAAQPVGLPARRRRPGILARRRPSAPGRPSGPPDPRGAPACGGPWSSWPSPWPSWPAPAARPRRGRCSSPPRARPRPSARRGSPCRS